MFKAGDSIFVTKNIKLICAFITMGHKLIEGESSVIEENGKREVCFAFDNKGGQVSRDAKKWESGLDNMDPEEPIAYLWAYAHNRDRLLDEIKKAIPMVRVRYGNKMVMYPKNASSEHKRKLMEKL